MNLTQKLAITGTLLVALVGASGCTEKSVEPRKDPYESSKKVGELFQRDLPEAMCESMGKTIVYPLAETGKQGKTEKQDRPRYD